MTHFTTIKDIAHHLNISVSTVSRAMRDTHDVSSETKQRVLELALDLNYKPNYNATALASGGSHNIGIILPFITNYYFSTVITGIQEVAYRHGYNMVLFTTDDCPDKELSVAENLFISGLDGLLVCTSSCNSDHLQELVNKGMPLVFFDRVASAVKTSKVMQDDYNGAFEAVEHLIENGYEKIAHIAGPEGLMITERRLQGYLTALKKYHLPVREEWIIHSGFSQDCGTADTIRLLECEEQPDAIFATNDRKAIGAILALKDRNVRIGKDIGVIGFTNDPMSALISPSLTTIAEPAFDIGKESCELLLNHIRKRNFIPEERILAGRLIVRQSTMRSFGD
jgi:LacI family transcriptional regulator